MADAVRFCEMCGAPRPALAAVAARPVPLSALASAESDASMPPALLGAPDDDWAAPPAVPAVSRAPAAAARASAARAPAAPPAAVPAAPLELFPTDGPQPPPLPSLPSAAAIPDIGSIPALPTHSRQRAGPHANAPEPPQAPPPVERFAFEPEEDPTQSTSGFALASESEAVPAAPPAPPSRERLRAMRIAELAGYPPRPQTLRASIGYCARVLVRRRALDVEVAKVAEARKRARDAAETALMALADALVAQRADPRLQPLEGHFVGVDRVSGALGETEAATREHNASVLAHFEELGRRIQERLAVIEEMRGDEAHFQGQLDQMNERAQRAQATLQLVDQQIRKQATAQPPDPRRMAALAAERSARQAELRMIEVQLSPVASEVDLKRGEIAKELEALAQLYEAQRDAGEVLGEASDRHRQAGNLARTAYREKMLALAKAALEEKVHDVVGAPGTRARDAVQQVRVRRDEEDLHVAARDSFDADGYRKGLTILLGASVGSFVLLALLILI